MRARARPVWVACGVLKISAPMSARVKGLNRSDTGTVQVTAASRLPGESNSHALLTDIEQLIAEYLLKSSPWWIL